jgi:hypothetical protein
LDIGILISVLRPTTQGSSAMAGKYVFCLSFFQRELGRTSIAEAWKLQVADEALTALLVEGTTAKFCWRRAVASPDLVLGRPRGPWCR